ncbi:hypothetical protein UNSWDHB_1619 [Dehalobacter sp. UNSWDHB]|nr:hypothetical protein DHBDCA_p1756 [Dehalobacter sp. DCA]AFV05767.1 hypothetical protein DCF50_p1765 [Dehalobacter sp. CF]EQB21084.1 hypothetical protein UNSWDHB_1619 [Dehalobacter sp. UNSWDHB]
MKRGSPKGKPKKNMLFTSFYIGKCIQFQYMFIMPKNYLVYDTGRLVSLSKR